MKLLDFEITGFFQVKGSRRMYLQKEGVGGFSKILVIWLLRELWK
jgi:hypothetical protein